MSIRFFALLCFSNLVGSCKSTRSCQLPRIQLIVGFQLTDDVRGKREARVLEKVMDDLIVVEKEGFIGKKGHVTVIDKFIFDEKYVVDNCKKTDFSTKQARHNITIIPQPDQDYLRCFDEVAKRAQTVTIEWKQVWKPRSFEKVVVLLFLSGRSKVCDTDRDYIGEVTKKFPFLYIIVINIFSKDSIKSQMALISNEQYNLVEIQERVGAFIYKQAVANCPISYCNTYAADIVMAVEVSESMRLLVDKSIENLHLIDSQLLPLPTFINSKLPFGSYGARFSLNVFSSSFARGLEPITSSCIESGDCSKFLASEFFPSNFQTGILADSDEQPHLATLFERLIDVFKNQERDFRNFQITYGTMYQRRRLLIILGSSSDFLGHHQSGEMVLQRIQSAYGQLKLQFPDLYTVFINIGAREKLENQNSRKIGFDQEFNMRDTELGCENYISITNLFNNLTFLPCNKPPNPRVEIDSGPRHPTPKPGSGFEPEIYGGAGGQPIVGRNVRTAGRPGIEWTEAPPGEFIGVPFNGNPPELSKSSGNLRVVEGEAAGGCGCCSNCCNPEIENLTEFWRILIILIIVLAFLVALVVLAMGLITLKDYVECRKANQRERELALERHSTGSMYSSTQSLSFHHPPNPNPLPPEHYGHQIAGQNVGGIPSIQPQTLPQGNAGRSSDGSYLKTSANVKTVQPTRNAQNLPSLSLNQPQR